MTRLKRMLTPRHRAHHTHTNVGAGPNPVTSVKREGRRAGRFFSRRAHAATATAAPVTTGPRRRRGLFSRRAAAPVAGGVGGGHPYHNRSKFASLTALFSRNKRGHPHTNHAGGHAHYVA
ncbi:hypothetical protein BGX33_012373 [Mortierella sp. NVP41]|nr:hypothetical protein BGX33_012373 [Mortierella sp. NVP41]